MADRTRLLRVAFPAEQSADPFATPVEVRFLLSATGERESTTRPADLSSWAVARGSRQYLHTNLLLNALTDARVGGTSLMQSTAYHGVAMWQFVPSLIWETVYFAVELVEALLEAIDETRPEAVLVVRSHQGPVADLWDGLTRSVCESRGIALTFATEDGKGPRTLRTRLRAALKASWVGHAVRSLRTMTAAARELWTVIRLRVAVGIRVGTHGRQEERRKLLFATLSRHWVQDPANSNRKWEEQLYPLLPSLRESGWTRIVGIDCPYSRTSQDVRALRERVRDVDSGVLWRSYYGYRAWWKVPGKKSRSSLEEMWQAICDDRAFRQALTYRGVPLLPALRHRLQGVFLRDLPDCIGVLDAAGRMLDRESPDGVAATYETGTFARALIIEADRRGIPTVGLQHGMIFKDHYYYSDRRVTTKPISDLDGFAVPKRTLVWGPKWARTLTDDGSYPEDAVAVTGNWRYDSVLAQADVIRDEMRAALGIEATARLVLLLSSGPNAPRFVEQCLSALGDMSSSKVAVKLHPALDPAPVREVLEAFGLPASALLADRIAAAILASDLVVSQISTVVSEAVLLDKPVVLVNTEKAGGAKDYVDTGVCLYATDSDDLHELIRRGLEDDQTRSVMKEARAAFVADYFFRTDGLAASRVVAELSRLADRRT